MGNENANRSMHIKKEKGRMKLNEKENRGESCGIVVSACGPDTLSCAAPVSPLSPQNSDSFMINSVMIK